jgi:hypothetical protein
MKTFNQRSLTFKPLRDLLSPVLGLYGTGGAATDGITGLDLASGLFDSQLTREQQLDWLTQLVQSRPGWSSSNAAATSAVLGNPSGSLHLVGEPGGTRRRS